MREPLLSAMTQKGFSARALAKELQRRKPRAGGDERAGAESWRNTIVRYITKNDARRQVPDKETAILLALILGKPEGFFVTPPAPVLLREERDQLKAELDQALEERDRYRQQLQELREVIARLRAESGDG